MKLSEQVCTLEQAKRLAELGVEQITSLHVFLADEDDCPFNRLFWDLWSSEFGNASEVTDHEYYAAFTVAELGVMLPEFIAEDELYTPTFSRSLKNKRWYANYYGLTKFLFDKKANMWHTNEAQSRAQLLIHLLETGKVSAEDCNARLTQ